MPTAVDADPREQPCLSNASEAIAAQGPLRDLDHVETLAEVQENGGFDRVLRPFSANAPECLLVAQHVTTVTK